MHPPLAASTLQYITFKGTETNPDRDILPTGEPKMQEGTWNAETEESLDEDRTYVYRSTGQCAGVLTNQARKALNRIYTGTKFVEDLINLLQRYKHKQGPNRAPTTTNMLLPQTYTNALRHLGISTERNTSPLTRSLPTYWSPQEDDSNFGSK
jgi:hypothetical protein